MGQVSESGDSPVVNGAKTGAVGAADARLVELVAAWPALSDAVKSTIFTDCDFVCSRGVVELVVQSSRHVLPVDGLVDRSYRSPTGSCPIIAFASWPMAMSDPASLQNLCHLAGTVGEFFRIDAQSLQHCHEQV